ncbi:MAG TPA: RNA polymerase sigma factor [Bryobacteraceae bacterium]|nr:RNA polymerase sigma factor [Bryobacteraceae bacterium]
MLSVAAQSITAPCNVAEPSHAAVFSLDDVGLRNALETHHAESYGWALSCCRRRGDEAENVLQLVYLKVLSGKAVFDGRSSFKTWLFAVIRKTAAHQRRMELLHRLRLSQIPKALDRKSPGERSGVETRLKEALGKLPARQREVLQLVFYHDLSIVEAAKVMGVGIGSARTHYERGKKQMRRRLA